MEEHRAKAPRLVSFAVVVCSSSRFKAQMAGKPFRDESGDLAAKLIERCGFKMTRRLLLPDDEEVIRRTVKELCSSVDVDVVVLSGGTGLSPTDVTVEAVEPLFEKRIPGFGEIFRMLTFQAEGSAAILSRTTAGVCKGKPVFVIPGSPKAVRLALKKLILPEAGHLVLHAKGLG